MVRREDGGEREKDMKGAGRGFVPGGRADADSVVEEDRVTLIGSILDEVVFLRVFGRIPVATGGGFCCQKEESLLEDERPKSRKSIPPVISQAMCSNQNRFRPRTRMFGCAKRGSDGVRSGFLRRVAKWRWGGPGGGDGEKVNELIIVGPFWTSPL